MLTLGLFEGVFFGAIGALALIGLATGGAPLHRIFGPVVAAVVAVIAVGVIQEGGAPLVADVLGLLFGAAIVFGVPLAVMRFAWAETHGRAHAIEPHPVARSESPARAAHQPPIPLAPPLAPKKAA